MGRSECSWDTFVRGVKAAITFLFSHVGLMCLVMAYSVAGAFLFKWLEQRFVVSHYDSKFNRDECLSDLYNMTEELWRPNPDDWRAKVAARLTQFEGGVVKAVKDQLYDQGPEEQRDKWNFIGSLFYCVTVITTIGYGHIAPQTWEGRLVTIVYAILGIPLMVLCLTNIGDSMASTFRFTYRRICCCCCHPKEEDTTTEATLSTPLNNNNSSSPTPYVPPPQYKPNRRHMLISPPISTTIRRGADQLEKKTTEKKGSKQQQGQQGRQTPLSSRPSQVTIHPDPEVHRIIMECSAYNRRVQGGGAPDPEDRGPECHDYDMVTVQRLTESPSPPSIRIDDSWNTHSPTSTSSTPRDTAPPSSPRFRRQGVWGENGGPPHITFEPQLELPRSGLSTQAGSPLMSHHGSTSSLPIGGGMSGDGGPSRQWSPHASTLSVSAASPYPSSSGQAFSFEFTNHHELPPPVAPQPAQTSPGKTLVVYNTLSGDALLQQSKVARKMALMSKGGFGSVRSEPTTMFTDPITGLAVDGDSLGLSYRPIGPDTSDEDTRVPILIVFFFLAGYLALGALLFVWLEDWPFLDSGYFCFITLSTIGFGDFVPGKSLGYETQEAQIKLVAGSMYLLLGLAVLAMSFNLVQEEVVIKCKALAHYIGLLKE